MLNSDTELLFPTRVIPTLRNLRGPEWQNLIDRLSGETVEEIDLVAFTAMITRLGGCNGCNADSFRAMRGCTQCAKITIRRYKSTDSDLVQLFNNARKDVDEFLSKRKLSVE